MEDGCVFCKIVKGDIPAKKVYEDKNFLGFLDILPVSRGHVMIIPKKHYRWTWDVPNFGEYWEAVKKVTLKIIKSLKAEKVHYITLGEAVPHAHIHIVPRFKGDGLKPLPDWDRTLEKEISDNEMQQIADTIKSEI